MSRARYVMTPARRAALKKAQAASARARKRVKKTSRRKKIAAGTGVALVAGGIAIRKSNISTVPKAMGYSQNGIKLAKKLPKQAKLTVPGPGTRISVTRTSGRSAINKARLPGGQKGSIMVGSARDLQRKRYSSVRIVSPSGTRRGVSLAGYAAGRRKPSLGQRLIVEYKHYALFGNKTASRVPKISDPPTILGPNQRLSINQQIANSLKKSQNSSIKSAAVNKKAITSYSVGSRSRMGKVQKVINELVGTPVYGTGGKKKYKKK